MPNVGGRVGPEGFSFGEWRYGAACKESGYDARWWFPEVKSQNNSKKAVAVCDVCPVRVECLEYALALPEPHGVWGGMTETARRTEMRRRSRLVVTGV